MNLSNAHHTAHIRQELAQVYQAERDLKQLYNRLELQKFQLAERYSAMSNLEQTVKNLKSITFTAIYHRMVGDKQNELNQKQVEFLGAKFKYDGCLSGINKLKSKLNSLQQTFNKKQSLENKLKAMINEAPSRLQYSGDKTYLVLSEELTNCETKLIDLRAANSAANQVLRTTKSTLNRLDAAGNWGLVDIIGGGIFVTAVKHTKIKDAKTEIRPLRQHIDNLHQKMKVLNVKLDGPVEINIKLFLSLADFILDGLIFDWMVQKKIDQYKRKLTQFRSEVTAIKSKLIYYIDRQKLKITKKKQSIHNLLKLN